MNTYQVFRFCQDNPKDFPPRRMIVDATNPISAITEVYSYDVDGYTLEENEVLAQELEEAIETNGLGIWWAEVNGVSLNVERFYLDIN